MEDSTLSIIVSSAVVSTVVSGLIGGFFAMRARRDEYKYRYFGTVLDKRLLAYEACEKLILGLKLSEPGSDGRLHHFVFGGENGELDFTLLLMPVMQQEIWLSDQLFDVVRDLNRMISSRSPEIEMINFAQDQYREIALLRERIEKAYAKDMLKLHEVASFLKSKKTTLAGFEEFSSPRC